MARSYARIMTAIWRDDDFLALSERAQRVYMLLVTQPDISAAGTLPLRVRRWAAMAKDTNGTTLAEGLEELAAARFIIADRSTEELLIRSFIKWDGGFTNRKRVPVIVAAAYDISSHDLRAAVAAEMSRVGLSTDSLADAPSDSASDSASVVELAEVREERAEQALSQVDSLSDALSDALSPSDRVVVGYVSSSVTTTHNPQPFPPTAGAGEPLGAQAIVGAWIQACRKRPPKNVIGQIAKHVKALLEEGIDPEDVAAGVAEWAAKADLHPSTLPSVVNGVMNRSARRPARRPNADDTIRELLNPTGTDAVVLQLTRGDT